MAAIEQTGGRLFVERLRLEWRPGTPIPEPTGRLTFQPVDDQVRFIALLTTVLDGTLDAQDRADLARMSPEEVALKQYEEDLLRFDSPREWWRIAAGPDGEPVGLRHSRAQRQPDHRLSRRRTRASGQRLCP